MMDDNALQVFDFKNNPVRVVMDEQGEPWFVLRDVLRAQGTTTPSTKAVSAIEQGLGKGFTNDQPLQTSGGTQRFTTISTPAVTFLVSRSNTELGRAMNKWIHADVLPTIRKHGGYLTPAKIEEALLDPDVLIRLATELKKERAMRIEAERTKAQISSNREATVMGRLSGAVRENRKLKDQLGEGETWKQARF